MRRLGQLRQSDPVLRAPPLPEDRRPIAPPAPLRQLALPYPPICLRLRLFPNAITAS